MSEADLMRRLQIAASRLGARLFRQNTGMGWIGQARRIVHPGMIKVHKGDVVISNARPFHAGVPGMSDLGGWYSVEITAGMVGQRIAIVVQAEVKFGKGQASDEQDAWIAAVNKAGGRAAVVRSESDLGKLLGLS